MAQISKEERKRREAINSRGIKALHKLLDKAAVDFGDPKAFKKGNHHSRMFEQALGTWTPPEPVVGNADGSVGYGIGAREDAGHKPGKAQAEAT